MQQTPSWTPAKPRRSILRNPTPLQLMELAGWSLLGWVYWMALMVFVVWTIAQSQVVESFRRQPQLVTNLYEYAEISDAWQALSVTADVAEPILTVIQRLKAIGAWELVRLNMSKTNLIAAVALEATEPALDSVVKVGNELKAVGRLEQTAQDAERYLAEPSIANLRLLAVSCKDGGSALHKAKQDLDGLTSAVRPFADTIRISFNSSADSVRKLALLMGNVADPLEQLAGALDGVAYPIQRLLDEADRYNQRLAVDADALDEVRDYIATAQIREARFTLFLFRFPVLWLLDHLPLCNTALLTLIVARLFFAYRIAIPGGFHSPRRQPGFALPSNI